MVEFVNFDFFFLFLNHLFTLFLLIHSNQDSITVKHEIAKF